MPLWGSNDVASNSAIFAAAQVQVAPNTANRTALFGNATADAFIAGVTVGQYGVDAAEVAAGGGTAAHTGWVLRTTGQGGRAGRVTEEVLVAGGISGDAENVVYPNYAIRVTSQPSNFTITTSANTNNTAVISVTAATVPAGGTITYRWVANSGAGFVNAAAGTIGNTTASLTVFGNTIANGTTFKVIMNTTGGAAQVNSTPATLTIIS
jgi:hypothetical protein